MFLALKLGKYELLRTLRTSHLAMPHLTNEGKLVVHCGTEG
jgi:hypothetical protein